MPHLRTRSIATALASFLTLPAAAQGDECSNALPVTVGTYGPFDSTSATTSQPAWGCASGGNDLWFVALANANGSATFDTCGSGFDTCIEVFDGTAGCTNLTSIACNDDSCGTRSSATVAVTAGQQLYVRVGGWNSRAGAFVLNVSGDIGPETSLATALDYGAGCYQERATFYEHINDPANFDLSNSSFTMLPTGGGGYTVIAGIAPFVQPTPAAANLGMGDDTQSTQALTTPFPHAGTTLSALVVYSNGFVATGSSNATLGTIITNNFFDEPDDAWRNWHDYDPSAGGQVTFEEIGTTAYFTWTDVPDWNVPGSMSTFQFQFDSATGNVTFAFEQMSLTGGGGGGNGHIVGYSPGGVSLRPAELDLSTALLASISVDGADSQELTLAADSRPLLGSTVNVVTLDVPATAALGVQIFGLNQINPGTDLGAFGMAGCRQYLSTDASGILVPAGGTASWSVNAPTSATFAGVAIFAQSLMLVPGANLLGALTSNGVTLRFDVN